MLNDGANEADGSYDFISRSTTDLTKTARGHEYEEQRISAVIKMWEDSPEASGMSK